MNGETILSIYISSYNDPYLNLAIKKILLKNTEEELIKIVSELYNE